MVQTLTRSETRVTMCQVGFC